MSPRDWFRCVAEAAFKRMLVIRSSEPMAVLVFASPDLGKRLIVSVVEEINPKPVVGPGHWERFRAKDDSSFHGYPCPDSISSPPDTEAAWAGELANKIAACPSGVGWPFSWGEAKRTKANVF